MPRSVQAALSEGAANSSLVRDYERMDAQAVGECTGSILAAGLFTANLGLILRSAVAACPTGELLEEIFEANVPWHPNGTLKKPLGRRLAADDRRLAEIEDPETRKAFLRMATAKHRVLADLHTDNETLRQLFKTFLHQQHRDLKAVCARDVLEFVSAGAIAAGYCEVAEEACATDRVMKQDCRTAVTGLVNKFPRAARFAAQMVVRCPKRGTVFDPLLELQPDTSYNCAGRMEGVAWHISSIGAKVQTAIDRCPAVEKGPPKINIGGCVTMVVSAAAYLGASAIALDSAGKQDCVNMTAYDMALAKMAAKGSEKAYKELVNDHQGRNLKCARDIIAAMRTLGLASMKATGAAEYCGGFHTPCGKDIASAATAAVAAVEAFVLAAEQCQLKPFHKEDDVESRNVQCAAYAASATKEMSVAAALSFEASQSCRLTNSAAGACASTVSSALAGFSYMMERMALTVRQCPTPGVQSGRNAYNCGHLLEHIGQATLVASTAIGSATINCGLGMRPSPTKSFKLNRRFWVPR